MGCFVIAGPESRNLLAKVAYGDVSNEALPFGTSKEIYVGRVKCQINRMSYVGELGYEIFHPLESQIALFKTLMEAGAQFELKMFGMYAMESMRLEKGYLAWKSEMNVHHTPLETNLAWTVKWDKDFIGKQALEKVKAEGVRQQLVCLVVEAEDSDPWGYNPIFKDNAACRHDFIRRLRSPRGKKHCLRLCLARVDRSRHEAGSGGAGQKTAGRSRRDAVVRSRRTRK